jgi:hypothetical protein
VKIFTISKKIKKMKKIKVKLGCKGSKGGCSPKQQKETNLWMNQEKCNVLNLNKKL